MKKENAASPPKNLVHCTPLKADSIIVTAFVLSNECAVSCLEKRSLISCCFIVRKPLPKFGTASFMD